jgi:hypothetical protein
MAAGLIPTAYCAGWPMTGSSSSGLEGTDQLINDDIEELSALADFEQSYLRPLPISGFADATW